MFDNILVYINPNLPSSSLIVCAMQVAKSHQAKVTLMSTIAEFDTRLEFGIAKELLQDIHTDQKNSVQTTLDSIKQTLTQSGINTDVVITGGRPYIEVSRQVLRGGHNLVMLLADEQQSGISKTFFGSTQMQLLRHCPCAVWVVKADSRPTARHILAPIDVEFDDPEEATINASIVNVARGMAQKGCLSVEFMHVWSLYAEGYLSVRSGLSGKEIKSLRKQHKREVKQKLHNLVYQTDWQDLMVDLVLPRNTLASREIIKAVKKKKIDLLIMGTMCRTGIEGFFIGNTAEKILTEVSCSVLALKPQGFVSPITL